MNNQELENWDLENIYDEQISPLITKIIAICKEHKLPMIASFAFRNNEDGADLCTTNLPFENRILQTFTDAFYAIKERNGSGVPPMKLTTLDKDGKPIKQEIIIG